MLQETPQQAQQRQQLETMFPQVLQPQSSPGGMFGMAQQAPEPFVWGQGGQRKTMDDLARERAMAEQMSAAGMDFSPVGHWTQGAARLASAISGKVQGNRVDKAEAAMRDESGAVVEALLSGRADPLEVMADPYLGEEARSVAGMLFEQQNQATDYNAFERMLLGAGYQPGTPEWVEANRAAIAARNDPVITATLPGDRFYSGPQSRLPEILGGGGQVSGAAGEVPDTLPPDFFDNEPASIQNTPAPQLNAQGLPPVLTRRQYEAVVQARGQQATDAWVARHGVQVEGR
jgi:hypothetical protein